ncbi:MAG: molybdopterin converting factor subunit 1 [Deltaproteobacteria bacterium]|nr:molybdopterin converting factor subunit 1 [Deltaproteobacteria bacterium]
MKVDVLYFAVFRERLARDTESLELPDGARVRDAVDALAARHAAIAALRGRFRVAVNQDFADDDRALADGDEVALIPPVAGGSGARHVRLLAEPLSLDRCIAAVSDAGMGGVVTFVGVVRRHSRGVVVERLEYSAYEAMAVREMTKLVEEIEAEVAGCRVAVEHRVGTLAIGDAAVAIAAAAPHRAEAFTACRAMIDRLKDRVPIWKKEVGEDGAEWVGLGP